MAQSNSIAHAWNRLNEAVYAVEALGQIISRTSPDGPSYWDSVSSVFCHLAVSLADARNAYEDELAANCQPPYQEVARG